MQLCPQCGHLNDERAKFCSECGTKLPTVVSIAPSTAPAPTDEVPIEHLESAPPAATSQIETAEQELLDRINLELEDSDPSVGTAKPDASTGIVDLPPAQVRSTPPTKINPVVPPTPVPVAPLSPSPRLLVIRGERINIEYPIYPGKNYLGRSDEKPVDIDLEDQERSDKIWSSRQHAIIHFENGALMIEDLNSLNGTFVNRVRLLPGQPRTLRANDVVQIGTVQMKLVLG